MTNRSTPHPAATEPARARGLERVEDEHGLVLLRSPLLASLAIPHAFTTRRGGGGDDDLDAGALTERDRARVLAAGAFDPASEIVHARQVHGREIASFDGERAPAAPPCADALTTSRERRALLVYTADCVPILIARADGTRVGAVHAGWRGLVAGVIACALDALRDEAGVEHDALCDETRGEQDGPGDCDAVAPAASGGELVAVIGPCLSLARFEVGPEVVDAFQAAELGAAVHARGGARAHVDLRGAARLELERGGVRRTDVSDRCTWDDAELWSYRRDVTHGGRPRTGRLGALIACRRGSRRDALRDARRSEREP